LAYALASDRMAHHVAKQKAIPESGQLA
jgi:hypothetical protein